MRLTFVISSLGAGGAERVMSQMANYWIANGWTITLITFAKTDSDFYNLDKRIIRIPLDLEKQSTGIFDAGFNNLFRISKLRTAIKLSRPDVVISFMDTVNVCTLLATAFTHIPVVIAERIDPLHHQIGKIWNILRKCTYPMANALVVQTHDVLKWTRTLSVEKKSWVIPNPISEIANQHKCLNSQFPHPFILAVGRLSHQKGFDLLLQAFQRISLKYADWKLVILGEGEERGSLRNLCETLGITERVYLHGLHPHPETVMRQASLYVLSSRYEGFPNALLEAMAYNTPVISFACQSGPNEIIRNGFDGILIPPENIDALVDAISDLIDDPEKRKQLGEHATEVANRFSIHRIMGMWEDVLMKCITR